jgi:hypothetical protein
MDSGENRIDVSTPELLAYWSNELGVSGFHLKKIIAKVGPRLTDVCYALGLRKWEDPRYRRR